MPEINYQTGQCPFSYLMEQLPTPVITSKNSNHGEDEDPVALTCKPQIPDQPVIENLFLMTNLCVHETLTEHLLCYRSQC